MNNPTVSWGAQHSAPVTDPSVRWSIEDLNKARAKMRQDRQELRAAIQAGYVSLSDVLESAFNSHSPLARTHFKTVLVWSGLSPLDASKIVRWMLVTTGKLHTPRSPDTLPLSWFVARPSRRKRVLVLADALARNNRQVPHGGYPFTGDEEW